MPVPALILLSCTVRINSSYSYCQKLYEFLGAQRAHGAACQDCAGDHMVKFEMEELILMRALVWSLLGQVKGERCSVG